MTSPLHRSSPHESGLRHTTGEALYVDDLPMPQGALVGMVVASPHPSARIVRVDLAAARAVPGVHAVLVADDIPGDPLIGPAVHDEPLLALGEVHAVGQPVALVVGETYAACRAGVAAVVVDYAPHPAILSIEAAIAAGSYLGTPHVIARGDVEAALAVASVRIDGACTSSGQDHFYLETQAALAEPEEDGTWRIWSSTQHPTEIQRMVAHVLGIGHHRVVCAVPRMGGGFGGKESQATAWAALAALGAHHTGRAVKVWLDRDQDMQLTGNRHPFLSHYRAGFAEDGTLLALEVKTWADGGWSNDLSAAILDRALFHLDNAYHVPHLRFEGRVCRTNLPSNTAFRGFGGPQGMLVIEHALQAFAEEHDMDPAEVRARSFYVDGQRTPYGQELDDVRIDRIWTELRATSEYDERRELVARFNAGSPHSKRGIGFQPVKFGISFTNSILNQAGALVLVYADGTVQLNHGGTEMGQGLHTKMRAVAAHELGVALHDVRVMTTATDKVPNTSATAASSGSDLNGQAVAAACRTLRDRLVPIAAKLLDAEPESLVFADGSVHAAGGGSVPLAAVTKRAWLDKVSLAATGFYATPGIAYDRAKGKGTPFYYFAYGGAVTEVEVHGLTGEHRVRRIDILHDVGTSLVPSIDRGQVEGALVQGMGWLTCEEVLYDRQGRLITKGPSTYKIPAIGDVPRDLRVNLLARAPQEGVIHGSKAVGEPPFMLAISAITALRHAISAFGGKPAPLSLPATPESILRAIEHQRAP